MATVTRETDDRSNRAVDEFNVGGRKYLFFKSRDHDDKITALEPDGTTRQTASVSLDPDMLEFDRIGVEADFDIAATTLSVAERREFNKAVLMATTFIPMMEDSLTDMQAATAWTAAEQQRAMAAFYMGMGVAKADAETLGVDFVAAFDAGHTNDREAAQTTTSLTAGTYVNRDVKLTNGMTVDRLQLNSSVAVTVTMKLLHRTGAGTYDVKRSVDITHTGDSTWQGVRLLPFNVPATGNYFVGYYLSATTTMDTQTDNGTRATAATEATGTGFSMTDEQGKKPIVGARYRIDYPKIGDLNITDVDGRWKRLMDDL